MSTRKGWQKEQAVLQRAALQRRIKASQRGAGFTLLEILVALAIFVIGALAIINIFPPALGVIQGSENRTIATNNSRNTLARLQSNPDIVPDSIYPPSNYYPDDLINDDPFDVPLFVGAVSGTISRNESLPRTIREGDFEASALGNIKRIVGERHSVLRKEAIGPLYVITEYSHTGGTGVNNSVKVFVEDTIVGARVTATGELDFRDARLQTMNVPFNQRDYQHADSSGSAHTVGGPAEPANPFVHESRIAPNEWRGPDTIYYVSYRWQGSNGRTQGVVDEPVEMPTGTILPAARPRVLMGRSPGPASTIIDEEVTIRVKRTLKTYVDDPAPISEADSIRGYIPITDDDSTDNDDVPQDLRTTSSDDHSLVYNKVSVNYTVRDWRWLINNDSPAPIGQVDGKEAGTITLPQHNYDNDHLLDASTINDAGTTVYGLLTYRNGNYTDFDDDAQWNGEDDFSDDGRILTDASVPAAQRRNDDFGVNARKGIVRYDIEDAGGNPLPALKARTAYWTLDGWAQQLSVAARSYIPYLNIRAGNEREPWREYYWSGPAGANRDELYFAPTEAGKSVMVTFEYDAAASAPADYKTKTVILTIDENIESVSSLPVGFEPITRRGTKAIIDVPGDSNFDKDDITAILAVQGLSVQARTAWIEGERYQQASSSGYRPINQS